MVKHVKPHALIGLAGAGPAFDQPIIEALCEGFPKPLVFPLSNPTEKAEITAENAYNWSKGQCIFASGGSRSFMHAAIQVQSAQDSSVGWIQCVFAKLVYTTCMSCLYCRHSI